MTQVLEYITQNYTLFLVGAIIILLAVIGYYAEKTNFGQGKEHKTKDEKTNNKQIDLSNTGLMDITSETKNNIQNNTENLVKNEITPTTIINSNENIINDKPTNLETNPTEKNIQNNIDSNVQNNTENLVKNEITPTTIINSNENIINDKPINIETSPTENKENITKPVEEKEETVNPIIDAIHKELNLVSNSAIYNVEEIKKKETKNKKREEAFNKFSDEFDALLPKREIISDDLLSEIEDLELGKTQKFNLKDLKRFDNIKLPRISDTATEDQDIWKF